MSNHTPTPYRIGGRDGRAWTITTPESSHCAFPVIFGANGSRICNIDSREGEDCDANAAYIVQCVNSHDALLSSVTGLLAGRPLCRETSTSPGGDEMSLPTPTIESITHRHRRAWTQVNLHREECDWLLAQAEASAAMRPGYEALLAAATDALPDVEGYARSHGCGPLTTQRIQHRANKLRAAIAGAKPPKKEGTAWQPTP